MTNGKTVKGIVLLVAVAGLAALLSAPARAVPVTGTMSYMGFAAGDNTGIQLLNSTLMAMGNEFTPIGPGTQMFMINHASALPIVPEGTTSNVSFVPLWTSLSPAGVSFDLTSMSHLASATGFVNLAGLGTMHANGLDDTPYTWNMTFNYITGMFAFSADQAPLILQQTLTAVPAPPALALFVMGLSGVLLGRLRRAL